MKIEWVDLDGDAGEIIVGREQVARDMANTGPDGSHGVLPEDVIAAVAVQASDDRSGRATYIDRGSAEKLCGALAVELGWKVETP